MRCDGIRVLRGVIMLIITTIMLDCFGLSSTVIG